VLQEAAMLCYSQALIVLLYSTLSLASVPPAFACMDGAGAAASHFSLMYVKLPYNATMLLANVLLRV